MLELQNIGFCVADKTILEDINLKFDYGKIYAITGHNGSGKSTLVKIIMGILKQTQGNVVLDGKNINDLDIPARSKEGIGFTFQQPVKFKGLTVCDLLETAARGKLDFKCGCEYLSRVGLCAKDYYNRELSSSLSGGELKRIELAICLAENKKINIFDEPEAGIDIWSFGGLVDIFNDLRTRGVMTIIVTHQQKILDIADEIIVLNSSRVDACGKAKDILPSLKSGICKKLYTEAGNGQN
ncbi:MAG: ATP-binding cassette domain-containing protein [Christensenellales bacterium]